MKIRLPYMNGLLGIAALLLMLSGCAKDEVVAPCNADDPAFMTKGRTEPGTITPGQPANGGTVDGQRDIDDDGGSISDDGDDVGDGERNKKKKPS